MTAQELIDRSISCNEIAHGEYDADIAATLSAAADYGGRRNGSRMEYWGVTDGGDEWCVHLDHSDTDVRTQAGNTANNTML